MAFEISDEEAKEVLRIVGKKLEGINRVLEDAKKGKPIVRKKELEARQPIIENLVNRLKERY